MQKRHRPKQKEFIITIKPNKPLESHAELIITLRSIINYFNLKTKKAEIVQMIVGKQVIEDPEQTQEEIDAYKVYIELNKDKESVD